MMRFWHIVFILIERVGCIQHFQIVEDSGDDAKSTKGAACCRAQQPGWAGPDARVAGPRPCSRCRAATGTGADRLSPVSTQREVCRSASLSCRPAPRQNTPDRHDTGPGSRAQIKPQGCIIISVSKNFFPRSLPPAIDKKPILDS